MRVHYGIIFFLLRRVKKASRFFVPFLKVEFPLSFGQQSVDGDDDDDDIKIL